MREKLEIIKIFPGPDPDVEKWVGSIAPFETSSVSFEAMVGQYKEYFYSRGHRLDDTFGYSQASTKRHFTTKLAVKVPPAVNEGHELHTSLILTIAIYEKYLVTVCNMALADAEYCNDANSNPFILLLNKLNQKYCKLGMQFIMLPAENHSGGYLSFQLVWRNLLAESHLNEYYSLLKQGFQEYGEHFRIFADVLKKIELEEDTYTFPVFVSGG